MIITRDLTYHEICHETDKLSRVGAEARGRWAEEQAASHLKQQGFRILARRAKTPTGEIDLVARRRRLLLFVEVKFRDLTDDGLWAIHPQQQRRIAKAAEAWLATQPALTNLDMRFDAIVVNAKGTLTHIDDAFRPET